MRKTRRIDVDTRGVAIYARKSRITNKGDSIGVQFKQCAEYAKKELRVVTSLTVPIFRECCVMCRMGKSKPSSATS